MSCECRNCRGSSGSQTLAERLFRGVKKPSDLRTAVATVKFFNHGAGLCVWGGKRRGRMAHRAGLRSGRFRYRPTMSCDFSMNSGSLESLEPVGG